jgi:hypothetical protein
MADSSDAADGTTGVMRLTATEGVAMIKLKAQTRPTPMNWAA